MENKKTMMRVDKELLKELQKAKLVKAESYASVVKRLMDNERKTLKKPRKINGICPVCNYQNCRCGF